MPHHRPLHAFPGPALAAFCLGGLVAACNSPEPFRPAGRPTAEIVNPVAGATYRGGQTIQFSGTGADAEGSSLPGTSLTWWAELHHDGQTDPFMPVTTGPSGSVVIPTSGEVSANVWYRFYLRAVDGNGLADTTFRDIQPETVQLTVTSVPVGRTVTLDGQPRITPYSVAGVVGIDRQLGAPSPQVSPDSVYVFQSWSDGGAQTHTISTPASSATYTATLQATGPAHPPPTAVIVAPVAGATYHGGLTIQFSGTGTESGGSPLPGSSLGWWAELHHDTHTHPFMPVTTGSAGSVVIPTSGEVSANVFYRFYLRAVDARGLADTVVRDVLPEKIQLTVTSVPVGRTITLDGQPQVAPYTVTAVVGIEREIGAPSPQSGGDSTYTFQSWSDAGVQTHVISTPASNTTYSATFLATGPANQPPTVSITAPTPGSSSAVNTPVTVTAAAADVDGTVQQVQFFDGASSIGSDATSPYSITWTPTVTGAHTLTARATDNGGAVTTSAAVGVNVTGGGGDTQAPTVTLTAPADGTQNLNGVVTATATATDNVGVAGVEFQLDGEAVGEDLGAPYQMALPATSDYTTGVHVIRVRARDAAGNRSPWVAARVTFGGIVDEPAGFTRTSFVQNLGTIGTAMAFAPDGRLFICEQGGDLRVVKNGSLLANPFVRVPTTADGERGLLGVAFHPNFAANGFVYVYYTVTSGGTSHNRISRFTASGDVAVAGSELPIVELPNLSSATNHNGGALHFGPDGKLYVAVGDNATGSNAPSPTSRLGKMLRYNEDGSIPGDNPSIGTGVNQAIWAVGLRNPFTFGFQPGTGRLFINDVGQNTWEEINEGVAGANYGWPTTEGATSNPLFTGPLFTYRHGGSPAQNPSLVSGFAIVGSAFYNPSTVLFPPEYVGNYFFADYVDHWVNRLDLANDNAVYAFARLPNSVTDLQVGPDGALYALGYQINDTWGVWRWGH
jgi:glucose/arabinose dehydrogenase